MKKLLFILIVAGLFCGGCNDDENIDRDKIDFFKRNLSRQMTLKEVKATFGRPDDDIGSGLHIFVYHLQDGTVVMIGIADSVLYAKHVDGDGNVLQDLI